MATYLFRLNSITERFEGPRLRITGVRADEGVQSVHYNPVRKELVLVVANGNGDLSIVRVDPFAKTLGRRKVGVTSGLTTISILQIKNNILISYSREQQIHAKLLSATGRPLTAETLLGDIAAGSSNSGLLYSPISDSGLLFWEFFADPTNRIRYILGQIFRVN